MFTGDFEDFVAANTWGNVLDLLKKSFDDEKRYKLSLDKTRLNEITSAWLVDSNKISFICNKGMEYKVNEYTISMRFGFRLTGEYFDIFHRTLYEVSSYFGRHDKIYNAFGEVAVKAAPGYVDAFVANIPFVSDNENFTIKNFQYVFGNGPRAKNFYIEVDFNRNYILRQLTTFNVSAEEVISALLSTIDKCIDVSALPSRTSSIAKDFKYMEEVLTDNIERLFLAYIEGEEIKGNVKQYVVKYFYNDILDNEDVHVEKNISEFLDYLLRDIKKLDEIVEDIAIRDAVYDGKVNENIKYLDITFKPYTEVTGAINVRNLLAVETLMKGTMFSVMLSLRELRKKYPGPTVD